MSLDGQTSVWGADAPAVGDAMICAGGRGETLIAYAAEDGRELWRFLAAGWFTHSRFVSCNHQTMRPAEMAISMSLRRALANYLEAQKRAWRGITSPLHNGRSSVHRQPRLPCEQRAA